MCCVDGEHVKYVTVDPSVLPKADCTFAPVLVPILPPFPHGDWNAGHVSKDPHVLGIKHSDIIKHNFLVGDGKVVLIDFKAAQRSSGKEELESEYGLLEQLCNPSHRDGWEVLS